MQSINQEEKSEIAAESPFLIELFQRFNESEIEYCVLRNYDLLPFGTSDSDLDLHVAPYNLTETVRIAKSVATKHDGKCISFSKWKNMCQVCLCGKSNGRWWGLRLDILSKQSYKGIPFYSNESLLETAILKRGVRMARPDHSNILALLKDALSTGRVQENYLEATRAAIREACCPISEMLHFYFSERAVNGLLNFVEKPISVKFDAVCRSLRWSLMLKNLFRTPGCFCLGRLRSIVDRVRRVFDPPGGCVVILGTDGSGKSALIEGIRPVLDKALHCRSKYGHLRPGLLPSLARLFGKPVKEGPTTEPHAGKPSGFLGSLVRLSYYTMDYVLGYWIKVFPALVKRPCLYIFDRYFYDYLIDPRRSLISLPRWIIRIFGLFIPGPDIILCLGAEPEIIHERKPELPLEEVKRQIEALRQFCNKDKRAVWIDTGCSIEKSVDQALEAITSRMAARYE